MQKLKNKKATSVIEAVIVLLIVVIGVVGMFKVYNSSQKLSSSTSNKIQAIQIAREGIEDVKNIRDTNWILFGSDTKNCWNVGAYNTDCVGNNSTQKDIGEGRYLLIKDINNRWNLQIIGFSDDFPSANYISSTKVGLDSNGFYTQSGAVLDIKPTFTREIKIRYLKADNTVGDSNDTKMEVTSLVQWIDSSSNKSHKVEYKSILTNWKK